MRREIQAAEIRDVVRRLCVEANTRLGEDVLEALREGRRREVSSIGREAFDQLIENARIAQEEELPLCQDTGLAVVFVDMGQDVHIVGGELYEAIHEGVCRGYAEGRLRASSVDPLTRRPFGHSGPAIIHVEIHPGEIFKISVLPKGFGAENMSQVTLFAPAEGVEGIKSYVLERIEKAGPNPCPPLIVGVGIGGTMEKAALLAKRAMLRPLGQRHPDPATASLEEELLEDINKLGIGPQGLGGTITALAVHIETYPTHMGSLPVAVNLQCHCARHKEACL